MYNEILNYYNFIVLFGVTSGKLKRMNIFLDIDECRKDIELSNKLCKFDMCAMFNISGELIDFTVNEMLLRQYHLFERTYKYQFIYLAYKNGINVMINKKLINDNKYHICRHHDVYCQHDWIFNGSEEKQARQQFKDLGHIGKVLMYNGKILQYYADDSRWWQGPAGKVLFDLMDDKTQQLYQSIVRFP